MAQQGFDISKYITAADIVSAVTAGTIAYLTYKTKQDEPKPEQPQGRQTAPQGQSPQAAQPRGQAPAVPKKEPGWMKYCDDPSDPNEVAAARLQYRAEQLSNATGGAPSATGTFQGGRLTSATPTRLSGQQLINTLRGVENFAKANGFDPNVSVHLRSLARGNPYNVLKFVQNPSNAAKANELWQNYWSSLPSEIGPTRTAAVRAGNKALNQALLNLVNGAK